MDRGAFFQNLIILLEDCMAKGLNDKKSPTFIKYININFLYFLK